MYHKKKSKWQPKYPQKEYIPLWIDELVYKPMKIEREKERLEKQAKLIDEAKALGLISEDYVQNESDFIKNEVIIKNKQA